MNESNERSNLIRSLIYVDPEKPLSAGLKGLNNLGNTCYLNAVIQCLSQTVPLTKYLFNEPSPSCLIMNSREGRVGFVISYIRLVAQIWNNDEVVDLEFLKNFVGSFIKHFPQGMFLRQNDSHETLLFILDSLHTLLSRKVSYKITGKVESEIDTYMLESIKEWQAHYKNTHSYIIDLFGGQEQLQLQCMNCNKITKRYPASMTTVLELTNETNNLNDCLDHLTRVEQLEEGNKWQCDHCKEYTKALKKIGFWKLPEVFVFTLNRFVFSERLGGRFIKNNKLIEFPLTNLNMKPYISFIELPRYKYDLYAVACHTGRTHGGHYYSYCFNQSTDAWYCFDDNNVSPVSNLGNIICSEAYILFYKLRQ